MEVMSVLRDEHITRMSEENPLRLTFQAGDEIYNNGIVHIFSYLYERGKRQQHSDEYISTEFEGLKCSLHYGWLVLEGSIDALKSTYTLLFGEFDELPMQTDNYRYYYDEEKDRLVWDRKIFYTDMNKLKPHQRKAFDVDRLKHIQILVQERAAADKTADITENERKNRLKALNEIIKGKNVFVLKTVNQLYKEAILKKRDFSNKVICGCCKNEFNSSGELLDTSKHYNMSSRSRFFEFNDSKKQANLCVFCYLLYRSGYSKKRLLTVGKYQGTFNGDLLSLFRLKQLLAEITNKTGDITRPGYRMDKYFIKNEDDKLPRLSAGGPAETTLSIGYILFNYVIKESRKGIDLSELELVLFQEEGILKVYCFNKFQYLFSLFKTLDGVKLEESRKKVYAIPLFTEFFSKLFVKTSKKPFREIIALQIIAKEKFFDTLSELFFEKLYDKKNKKPVANIPEDILTGFMSTYNSEVIGMDSNIMEVAKQTGEKLGIFAQETKDLEPIYKLREMSSASKFIEYLRNSQFKAVKADRMIFSNEELDKIIKLVSNANESELRDRINLISCYAIQKYLAKDFVQSKKEGKQ